MQGALPGEMDIVVVCNGCTDNTAEVTRRFGTSIRVIETAIANKALALNLGDQAAGSAFPRIYVDADVVIAFDALQSLAQRLAKGDVLAVSPTPYIDVSGCRRLIRWFFDIAALLPSAKEGIGGSGVYALSRAGRARFDRFPNVIADDAYIRILFRAEECETIATLHSRVFVPRRFGALIRTRSRIRYGHLELARLFPELWQNRQSNNKAVLKLFRQIYLWPRLFIYCSVMAIARVNANLAFRKNSRIWDRDETSRRISEGKVRPVPSARTGS
jgi:glycosyltransferase involved in cell wall biosynthesis